ncbi:acyl carrier protein [Rosenbergiella epipactidis]|uniref:acyl carrier protein n=1 Tax=Rosenbergiella epipactidis TaxID=1544694 RepID=UPI001BD9B5A8|nr:acyl carrier protein [Rosenbergiella epipactidis]MBT0717742.1 acyl carrier protein [Rosenbergiella epipactidis]
MENKQQLLDYVIDCLGQLVAEGKTVNPDSDLVNDLGLESVNVMRLLMMLEDELDISIPINILMNVKTPEQLVAAIEPLIGEQ